MKLLLRRDQRQGLLGKVIFVLDVRAEISEEERSHIERYKLRDTTLYQRLPEEDPPPGTGFFAAGQYYAANITLTVNDLTNGKRIELKDIREMLGAEEQIKEAAKTLKALLARAAQFGGEELVEI